MLNKKLMILAIILVSLLAVSAVSAADNATSDVVSVEETDEILIIDSDDSNEANDYFLTSHSEPLFSKDNVEENMNDKSIGSFSDLYNDIQREGKNVVLKKDYAYNNTSDESYTNMLNIWESDITINGNGHTINGNYQSRAFEFFGSNIVIKNLKVINGYASYRYAGAISFRENNCTLINCSFINNYATSGGGAIHLEGSNHKIINCTFINNSATRNDGITSTGGAIEAYDSCQNCIVSNCTFINNTANLAGAIDWMGSYTIADNCFFINNTATTYSGGAIRWYEVENGKIIDCYFSNNYAEERGNDILWQSQNGYITNSYFNNENGICMWGGNSPNATITKCEFLLNCYNLTDTYKNTTNYSAYLTWNNFPVANKTIQFKISQGNEIYSVSVKTDNEGHAKISDLVSNLGIGIWNLTARFDGDDYCYPCNSFASIIIKYPVIMAMDDSLIATFNQTFNLSVSIVGLNNVSLNEGVITFFDNNNYIGSSSVVDGIATLEYVTKSIGNHTIKAEYSNNNIFADTTISTNLFINKADSIMNIPLMNLDYNDSITVKVFGEGFIAIKNAFIINQSDAIVNISNTNLTISNLSVGNYTLVVTNIPDSYHNAIQITFNITVNKIDSFVKFDDIIFDYEGYGKTIVSAVGCSIDLENISIINQDNATILFENNEIIVTGLDAGNYTLNIITTPDNNHKSIRGVCNVTVNKIDSKISLKDITFDYDMFGSTNISKEGVINYTANVINHPEAFVVINDDVIFVSGLDAGNYTLNVTTIPDKNHNSINITAKITVNKVNASIIIPTIIFDYGDFASVSPISNGIFKINQAFVANHKEALITISEDNQITVSGLNAGKYTLVVTLIPDKNHNVISSVTTDIIVNKINSSIIVPEINFNYGLYGSSKVIFDGATKFNANIINVDSTFLTINDDVIVVFGLDAGIYDLVVTTLPDNNHNAVSNVTKVTVNKLGTIVSSTNLAKIYGTSKNINIKLNDVNGNKLVGESIKVTLNNVDYYLKTNNYSQCIISVPSNLPPKTYTATITFNGNKNYDESTVNIKVTVKKATPKLTAKAKTFKKSVKTKKYTVTLKTNKNKALKKVKLSLKVKGKTYYATTNKYGKATFKITKLTKKGKYTATLKFKGSKYYKAKTVKPKITIK